MPTCTANTCEALRPSGSHAVISTVAMPSASPTTSTKPSHDTRTDTAAGFELFTVCESCATASSSNSPSSWMRAVPPTSKSRSSTVPIATGGWLGGSGPPSTRWFAAFSMLRLPRSNTAFIVPPRSRIVPPLSAPAPTLMPSASKSPSWTT